MSKLAKPYSAEEYRGYHLAWTEDYGTWRVYIQRKIIHGVGFATAANAQKWGRTEVDKLIAKRGVPQ